MKAKAFLQQQHRYPTRMSPEAQSLRYHGSFGILYGGWRYIAAAAMCWTCVIRSWILCDYLQELIWKFIIVIRRPF